MGSKTSATYRDHRSLYVALSAILFGGALVGCSARQRGPNEPEPGEPWIRKVKLKGAKSLDGDDIKDGLASRPPDGWIIVHKTRLDPALIERDRARIRTYYQTRGFFDAVVSAVDIKEISKKKSDVTFHVKEGPRSKVSEISMRGLPAEIETDPSFVLGPEVGDDFDHGEFADGQGAITGAALEQGYAHVEVKGWAEVDSKRREVALRYDMTPGPQVYFGDIEIRGLDIIPESAVRNRLKLKSGELFHPKKITQSQSSIRSLGRFGIVRIDFQNKAKSERGDLAVTVSEAPRREIRAGGGLGLDRDNFEVRARAQFTRHGIIDPLLSFSAQVRPAYAIVRAELTQRQLVGEASTSLTREDLFWPLARGKATLTYDVDVLQAYSSQGGDVALRFSRPLWDQRLQLGLGWRLELLDFFRIEDAIDAELRESLGLSSPYRSAFFEQSIALDLRDQPLNARNGFFAGLKLEEGGSFAGGSFEYGRVTPEVRGYHAFSDRIGVAGRATLGWPLWGTLPITRRFFSGGSNSHRGFSQRHLSPVAGENNTGSITIGGDKLAEVILETRFGLTKLADEWLGITFFADGGDVVLDQDDIDPANLHWALGSGLRYNTIVGPIRFDVGYRINRTEAGEIVAGNSVLDHLAFHLSIGEAF